MQVQFLRLWFDALKYISSNSLCCRITTQPVWQVIQMATSLWLIHARWIPAHPSQLPVVRGCNVRFFNDKLYLCSTLTNVSTASPTASCGDVTHSSLLLTHARASPISRMRTNHQQPHTHHVRMVMHGTYHAWPSHTTPAAAPGVVGGGEFPFGLRPSPTCGRSGASHALTSAHLRQASLYYIISVTLHNHGRIQHYVTFDTHSCALASLCSCWMRLPARESLADETSRRDAPASCERS